VNARGSMKKIVIGAAALATVGGGAVLLNDTAANAAGTVASAVTGTTSGAVDVSKSVRPNEHLLTGDTLKKVTAAALAKYPNATILRVESDSDGVYEAHVVTTDGQRLVVQVGSDFAVTGIQQGGGPGGARPGDAGSGDSSGGTSTTPGG